jgi:hypothetical protein
MNGEKEERKKFYDKVVALVGEEPKKGEIIKENAGRNKWLYGFSSYSESSAIVIHTTSLRFNEGWNMGRREKTLEVGPDQDKLFVGWEVVSNWTDGTNGEWWKTVEQILLTNHAAIHFKSLLDRGCDWTANFYWVDSKDYQFG